MKKELKAVYAGSFDPLTIGHMDILERALKIFPQVKLLIGINSAKKTKFTLEERLEMAKNAVSHLNIEVIAWDGLVVDYLNENEIAHLVRGVRSSLDYDQEGNLSHMDALVSSEIETIFFPARPEFSAISSTFVRELLAFHKDIESFVTKCIHNYINNLSA